MERLCLFPETIIVKKIRKKHSQAQFIERSNRIEFSREECSKLDPEFLRYVVYHEIGHWFRWNHVGWHRIDGRHGEGFLILDCTDPEEGFADGFAAHFIEHDTLARKHPTHDIVLNSMISGNEEKIRDFCDEVLGWLAGQLEIKEG
jgi:hypothetical protein